jgi:hypothetical protein
MSRTVTLAMTAASEGVSNSWARGIADILYIPIRRNIYHTQAISNMSGAQRGAWSSATALVRVYGVRAIKRDLATLTLPKQALYNDLRDNRYGKNLGLEQ